MTDVNDFLLGGSIQSATFDNPGDLAKGTIVALAVKQATDFDTKAPKTWDDGSPVMQLVVTLATDQRDPSRPDDDGKRRLYAQKSSKEGSMFRAIGDAVKAAGAGKIDEGGTLAVQYRDDDPESRNPRNPRKRYVAQYAAPALTAANDLLGAPAAPAPQAVAAPAPAPVAQAPAAAPLVATGSLI